MAMPMSPGQVRKRYEGIEKSQADDADSYYFQVRLNGEQKLIGFGEIYGIEWSNAAGFIRLGIGNQTDRRKGYGSEIMKLLQKFAFHELNLYRLTALIAGYNQPAIRLFKKNRFQEEARSRQAILRYGRRWDLLIFGLLVDDWVG